MRFFFVSGEGMYDDTKHWMFNFLPVVALSREDSVIVLSVSWLNFVINFGTGVDDEG